MIELNIALLPNLTRKHAREVTNSVCEFLSKRKVGFCFELELNGEFGEVNEYLCDDELFKKCDVAVAIGGDGSIIHAAKKACKYNKPILGINAGNLAFMAGVEKHEIELLDELIKGNYSTDRRMLLDVTAIDSGNNQIMQKDSCINDVVIARGDMIKLVHLDISCDGKKINQYYADGIIISTPTGSTAYSLSAGGPVVDPKIESILLTPICTHSLFARSLIFDSESEICVSVPDNETEKICISCDGDDSVSIPSGSKIIIKKSNIYADFIRIKNDSFIDVLNSKLAQRRV